MDSSRESVLKNRNNFMMFVNIMNDNEYSKKDISIISNEFYKKVEKDSGLLSTMDDSGKIIASWIARSSNKEFSRLFLTSYTDRKRTLLNFQDSKSISPIKYAAIYGNHYFLEAMNSCLNIINSENGLLICATKNNNLDFVRSLLNIKEDFLDNEIIESIDVAANEGFEGIYEVLYDRYNEILQRRKQEFIDGKNHFYYKEEIVKKISWFNENYVKVLSLVKERIPSLENNFCISMISTLGGSYINLLLTVGYSCIKLSTLLPYIKSLTACNEFKQHNNWTSWYADIRRQVDLSPLSPVELSTISSGASLNLNDKDERYEFNIEAVKNMNNDNQNNDPNVDPMSIIDEGKTESTASYSRYVYSSSGSQRHRTVQASPGRLAGQMGYFDEDNRSINVQPNNLSSTPRRVHIHRSDLSTPKTR